MNSFLISFFISTISCLMILRYKNIHTHFTSDHDILSIQKFHQIPVPRIGGIAIFLGISMAMLYRWSENEYIANFIFLILISTIPCFFMGLLEDITKKIGAKERLISAFISAGLAGYLLNAWLINIQFFGLDFILNIPTISILFTCFCVAGVTNSFNLIDGYHGLSSVVGGIILLAIAYVAFRVSDTAIMACAFAGVGAIFGFLIWNYPKGHLFLGDGGAYLIGFWVAELSLLLVTRNSIVSKWFPLLLCIYPIFETIFTIYRRLVLKKMSPGTPDASHLHQIIYYRAIRWAIGTTEIRLKNQRNALTAPYLWLLSSMATIPALFFWNNYIALMICSILFTFLYLWLYWSIVRFKTPKWMIIKK